MDELPENTPSPVKLAVIISVPIGSDEIEKTAVPPLPTGAEADYIPVSPRKLTDPVGDMQNRRSAGGNDRGERNLVADLN